jgi:hypothetical protein
MDCGVLVHNCDAFRYLMMTRPETLPQKEDIYKKIEYNSLEGQLYRELNELKNPKSNKDPFGL